MRQRQASKEASEDLAESRQAMLDDVEMTDGGLKVDFNSIDAHRARVEKAADKMGGKSGEALKVVAAMQGELNEIGRRCEEATDGFVKAIDWQTLAEKRDYEARREVLRNYIALNRQMLEKFNGYHRGVMSRLDAIGYTGAERRNFDRSFSRNQKETVELVRTIRQCDIDCSELALGIIDRLEKTGNGWRWNAAEERAEFVADGDAEWFNGEMKKIRELGEKQLKAQEDFAKLLKGA
jgi:hypothetical protein